MLALWLALHYSITWVTGIEEKERLGNLDLFLFSLGTNNLIERQTSDLEFGPNPEPSCCQGSNEQAACDVCLLQGWLQWFRGRPWHRAVVASGSQPADRIASGGGDLELT